MPQIEDLEIEDKQWKIREEAQDFEREEQHTAAAKLYMKLILNAHSNPLDLKKLNSTIYKYIDTNPGTSIKDFNFSEIQTILFSCNNVILHNEQDKARNNLLIEHLNAKTKDLADTLKIITDRALLILKLNSCEESNFALLPQDVLNVITELGAISAIADIGKTLVDISLAEPFSM